MINSKVLKGYSVKDTTNPFSTPYSSKLFLPGAVNGRSSKIYIDDDLLSKHMMLIGGTGCGKTNTFNFMIRQIKEKLTSDDIMVVFDTKGDYYKKFYTPGDYVISNQTEYGDNSSKWNIYKEITVDGYDDRNTYNNAYEIATALFRESLEKTNQVFFPSAARDVLVSIMLAFVRISESSIYGGESFKRERLNNKCLRNFLNTAGIPSIRKILDTRRYPELEDLRSVLGYLGQEANNQALGVIAELLNVCHQVFIGDFAEVGDFSVREFVRNKGGKTLFIEYDLSIGDTLASIYSLLFDLCLKEAMGRRSEGNVYLVCDEFKLLPYMKHIEDGVNFGRGKGVKILAGLQSIEQLYEIYGEARGKNIASGFSSVFAFKPNDTTTRNFISDLYGKNIVLEQYKTFSNIVTEEKREGKTVEDWDIISLNVGEAIVALTNEKPFKYRFDLYEEYYRYE